MFMPRIAMPRTARNYKSVPVIFSPPLNFIVQTIMDQFKRCSEDQPEFEIGANLQNQKITVYVELQILSIRRWYLSCAFEFFRHCATF